MALAGAAALIVMSRPAVAQPTPLTLESVDAKVSDAALAGHNGWMLTCCALVLFMTVPGLAMFYGGLVRRKNVLGVIMQCFFLMALNTVLWALYGYSLAFGTSEGALTPYIGGSDYLFMNGVSRTWDEATNSPATPMYAEGTTAQIPRLTHM
jgi:Amt family ammonium transporter